MDGGRFLDAGPNHIMLVSCIQFTFHIASGILVTVGWMTGFDKLWTYTVSLRRHVQLEDKEQTVETTYTTNPRSTMQVFVKDVWKEYTGWPLNDMKRSYKFTVHPVYHISSSTFTVPSKESSFCHCNYRSKYLPPHMPREHHMMTLNSPKFRFLVCLFDPSFARVVLSKDDLRKELEMDPDLPAVLLMGPVKKSAMILGDKTNMPINHYMWQRQRSRSIQYKS
ncbi:hypothetical protein PTKIN_Ptkin03bG0156300 [Pterospermum kingtungense]